MTDLLSTCVDEGNPRETAQVTFLGSGIGENQSGVALPAPDCVSPRDPLSCPVVQWVLERVDVVLGVVVVELEPAVVDVESLDDEALSDPEPHAAAPNTNRTAIDRLAVMLLMG